MLADPACQFRFREEALRQAKEGDEFLLLRSQEIAAVELEEGPTDDVGRALVSVDEGMILDQAEGVRRGQVGEVRRIGV